MSKILKNNTASNVILSDVGQTVPASGQLTINVQDYWLYATSSDVIVAISSGDLTVNDGSFDLSIADGARLIQGLFPTAILNKGNSDGTLIGNVSDSLKVIDQQAINVLNNISNALGGSGSGIFKFAEANITSRAKIDLAGTSYTVPSGKTFLLTSFIGSYDAQSLLYLRIEKQTGGVGAFQTLFRMNMMSGGQGDATLSMNFGAGIIVGSQTDVFKITVDSSIGKGTVWAAYSGVEL